MVAIPLEGLSNVEIVSVGIAAGLFALIYVAFLWGKVTAFGEGSETMAQIGKTIHEGAVSFLHAEYKVLSVFVIVIAACLCGILYDDKNKLMGVYTAICMIIGAILSAAAGYIGMSIATLANTRTCEASKGGLNAGLNVAFKSGSIMGLTVVAFGILGLSLLWLIFGHSETVKMTWQVLSGFGFGASSIALFARVGGGIYTKAADVGADLVGKVENDIPEDSPNNPATIADNVGDNVGDVAGMGADLFESYAGAIIAACTLATTEFKGEAHIAAGIALPFWVSGFGILCSIIGTFAIQTKDDGKDVSDASQANEILKSLLHTISKGIWLAGFLVIVMAIISCYLLFGLTDDILISGASAGLEETTQGWKFFMCILIGLVVGNVIGAFTEYSTAYTESPTQSIALASEYGPATVIIQGLGVGMLSTCIPCLAIVIAIVACDECAGVYGVAIAAVGMLSTLGITLATDAYGPVADNAGGIAEMDPGCSDKVRDTTDALDALGNTTAATGKGFAIGSAVLTASALMSAFMNAVGATVVDLKNPIVIVGVLVGAMLPFIFAALTMLSVNTAAMAIISEVRTQFKEKPWLKNTDKVYTGAEGADFTKCVTIATNASLEEMILPGGMAVFVPVVTGFVLGPTGLAGLLVGALASGFMLALTMSNAGGAWDNAKKYVEKGSLSIHGVIKQKGSPEHAAVVTGDTVGDPFKDTSGPALNVLIKLMTLVSLVLAPRFAKIYDTPEKMASGFAADGVIIGAIVLVIVFPTMFYMQSIFNKRNAARSKAALAGLNAPVPAKNTEQALSAPR